MSDPSAHPSFVTPTNPDVPIWRYVSLAKYISLLQTRALHFSRLDLLGDPFEGSLPRANVQIWEHIRENRRIDPDLAVFKDLSDERFNEIVKHQRAARKASQAVFYVNCWHMNEHESDAMWRLYGLNGESVAIRSTYRQLRSALPNEIHIGEVLYINYDTDAIAGNNLFNFVVRKRKSFEHERELRAVAWKPDNFSFDTNDKTRMPNGISSAVDLTKLVSAIHVSPAAPFWFAEAVEGLSERFELQVQVVRSKLSESPLF